MKYGCYFITRHTFCTNYRFGNVFLNAEPVCSSAQKALCYLEINNSFCLEGICMMSWALKLLSTRRQSMQLDNTWLIEKIHGQCYLHYFQYQGQTYHWGGLCCYCIAQYILVLYTNFANVQYGHQTYAPSMRMREPFHWGRCHMTLQTVHCLAHFGASGRPLHCRDSAAWRVWQKRHLILVRQLHTYICNYQQIQTIIPDRCGWTLPVCYRCLQGERFHEVPL